MSRRRRHAVTLADLLVCLVLLLILATWTVGQAVLLDDTASRVKCASNQRQIGQAILLYANENKGAYPRTTFDVKAADKPTWGTPYEGNDKLGPAPDKADPFVKDDKPGAEFKPKVNDVTAALFLLVRTQDITSGVFVCPATMREHWDYEGAPNTALNWTNWRGVKGLADHFSYSFADPYPSADAIAKGYRLNSALSGEFVVLADMNPGTAAVTKVNARSLPTELQKANSPNHNREGQNVLFGDGHVEFQQTPFCGVKRDNIYSYGVTGSDNDKTGGDGIVGSPVSADDSVLLPTAHDLKTVDDDGNLKDAIKPTEMSAAEKGAFQQKFAGRYVRQDGQRTIRLLIDKDEMVATTGPVTVTFQYDVAGALGQRVRVNLSASDTKPEAAIILIDPQGNLRIQGSNYYAGLWKRE